MTGLDPAVVVLLHDVTIRARGGIVREVRPSLRVNEGVGTQSDTKPTATPKAVT
jgi:hypothetical protein